VLGAFVDTIASSCFTDFGVDNLVEFLPVGYDGAWRSRRLVEVNCRSIYLLWVPTWQQRTKIRTPSTTDSSQASSSSKDTHSSSQINSRHSSIHKPFKSPFFDRQDLVYQYLQYRHHLALSQYIPRGTQEVLPQEQQRK
jgi:hypothetical protein